MTIAGGEVSVFGADEKLATKNCIQQTASGNDLASTWNCITSSDSALEGVEYTSYGSNGTLIRYFNLFSLREQN